LTDLLQTLLTAVVVGSLYALIALGYTMVYGILKFINFAHSDVFVLGAWSSFTISTLLISRLHLDPQHMPWWMGGLVLVLAMLVCALVGFAIERLAYKPLRKAPRLNVLITAIGVSLLMQNVGQLQFTIAPDLRLPFGTRPERMPALLPDTALNDSVIARGPVALAEGGAVKLEQPVQLDPDRAYRLDLTRPDGTVQSARVIPPAEAAGPQAALETIPSIDQAEAKGAAYALVRQPSVSIQLVDVTIVGSALVLMLLLEILVFRTKLGTAMRAVSFNVDNASLMGINVDRVISFTFVLGAMLAAAAGFLNALKYPGLNLPAHEIWVLLGLKAFVAAVVGGIGNLRGAVLGGFLIAAIEQFGMSYIDTNLRDVYVFAVLIGVLLFKPSGLLGTPVREKV
jgi:branched-chain amino acid transport system permease protein